MRGSPKRGARAKPPEGDRCPHEAGRPRAALLRGRGAAPPRWPPWAGCRDADWPAATQSAALPSLCLRGFVFSVPRRGPGLPASGRGAPLCATCAPWERPLTQSCPARRGAPSHTAFFTIFIVLWFVFFFPSFRAVPAQVRGRCGRRRARPAVPQLGASRLSRRHHRFPSRQRAVYACASPACARLGGRGRRSAGRAEEGGDGGAGARARGQPGGRGEAITLAELPGRPRVWGCASARGASSSLPPPPPPAPPSRVEGAGVGASSGVSARAAAILRQLQHTVRTHRGSGEGGQLLSTPSRQPRPEPLRTAFHPRSRRSAPGGGSARSGAGSGPGPAEAAEG